MTGVILAAVLGYALGSFPTAVLVGKITRGIDIRREGSGNMGAANAARVLGLWAGIAVALADIAKGALAVFLASQWFAEGAGLWNWMTPAQVAGLAAVAGHNWPVYLGFRGGKGIASAGGAVLLLAPWVVVPAVLIWVGLMLLTRYVALSSVAMFLALPVLFAWRPSGLSLVVFGTALAILVGIKHWPNLRRMMLGREKKLWR